jgi:hypothetical protein
MSPLPSSASMLCSASASFCFYALLFFFLCTTLLCSASLQHFMLCVLHLYILIPYLFLQTCITLKKKKLCILFVLHIFLTSSPLPDHHLNSSSSLVVMLSLFIISGRYPNILWLLWKSQLFIFSVSYSQSIMASLASKPLPSRDHHGDHTPNR